MKKNTGNKMVKRAIAIGLATMIATTSVPVTTFAETSETETTTTDSQPSQVQPATIIVIDQTQAKTEVNEAIQTPVVITKDGQVINTADRLNEKYPVENPSENAAAGLNAYGDKNNLEKNAQGQYINNVPGYIDESIALTTDALTNVGKFGQSDAKITGLKNEANSNLVDAKIIAVLEDVLDEGGNPVYEQDVDENGNPRFNEDGSLAYKMEPVYVQEKDAAGNLKYDANGAPILVAQIDETTGQPVMQKVTKKKLVYKDATGIETKNAVSAAETGLSDAGSDIRTANTSSNESAARAAAARISSDLETAKQGLDDMADILTKATNRYADTQTKYETAQKKLYEAEQELATQKEYLETAIKDSAAAHAALEATKNKVDTIKQEVDGLYEEADAAELELISKLYDAFKKKDNNKNEWINAGNLCKALIKYYVTHDTSYVSDFAISGGIDGEGYEDLSKDLLSYSKEVIDTFTQENTTDKDGNPMIEYKQGEASKYNFPDSEYNGKEYKWKEINGEKTGWVYETDNNGSHDNNNVVVVRYKYKDGDEIKGAERYFNVKIENGEIYFYERTIEVVTDEENSIAAKAGQYGYDDYFDEDNTDHKTGGLSTLYNEENGNANKVVDVITDENGKVTQKAVPASDTPRKDSVKNTPPQNDGNKITYEKAKDENGNFKESQKEYSWGQTEAISTSYEGTIKHTDKTDNTKAKTWDWNSLKKLNEQLSGKMTELSKDYPADQGYRVEVEYVVKDPVLGVEFYSKSKEASTYSDVEGWASGFLNDVAAFFGMASYDIKVVHKSNLEDGIIETETQEYVKTTNGSLDSGKDDGYKSRSKAQIAGENALKNALKEELKKYKVDYVEGQNTYEVTLEDGTKRTIKGSVTTDDYSYYVVATRYKYNYNITYTDKKNETVVISTKGYDGKLYNYAQRDEIVGNNGLTLQKIEWSADLKKDDEKSMDAGLVKSYISYRDAMKELQDAYDKVVAAEANAKTLEDKIALLTQQTVDRSELNRLQGELANAKSALEIAQADLNEKEQEYELLSGTKIDLSRFDVSDDDDDRPSSPGTPGGVFTLPSGIEVIPLAAAPASGVAGVRTGRRNSGTVASNNSGVLGVRTEGSDTTKKEDVEPDNKDEEKTESTDKDLKKVDNPTSPLAATPFEEGAGMNWLWLLAAAAAAGAGVYAYGNHRKKVAANEEAKKYKK